MQSIIHTLRVAVHAAGRSVFLSVACVGGCLRCTTDLALAWKLGTYPQPAGVVQPHFNAHSVAMMRSCAMEPRKDHRNEAGEKRGPPSPPPDM